MTRRKQSIIISFVALLIASISTIIVLHAQGRGTPSQIRVKIDATGALLTASAMQVNPVTSVQFNNARLAIDASGNLLTVGGGGGGAGTVTSIATTLPITGGTITDTGTIACPTCGVIGTGLQQFASTTSAQLAGVISNETGSGLLVFGTSPTLVTPTLGAATATSINSTTYSVSGVAGVDSVITIPGVATITISKGIVTGVN